MVDSSNGDFFFKSVFVDSQLRPCVAMCATTATVPTPPRSCVPPHTACARPSPQVRDSSPSCHPLDHFRILIGLWSFRNRRLTVFMFSSFLPANISSPTLLFMMTVTKNCSLPLDCSTPLNIETERSVNRGFSRESHTQLCCATDNCNFQTLASKSCFSLLPNSGSIQAHISQSPMSQTPKRLQLTLLRHCFHSWIHLLLFLILVIYLFILSASVSVVPSFLTNGKQCPACNSLNDSLGGTCNATLPCMGVEDSCFNGTSEFTSKFPSCGWSLKHLIN